MSCLRLHSRASVPTRAAEVLRGDDRGGVDAPEVGELHAALLEDGLAGLPVRLDDVATLPGELVVGVHALGAEDPLDLQALGLRVPCAAPLTVSVIVSRLLLVAVGSSSFTAGVCSCLLTVLQCVARRDASPLTHRGGLWSAGRLRLSASARARQREHGDLGLEVVGGLEGPVDAGEAQVGDLVELAQRPEDRQPDLVGRDLRPALAAQRRPRRSGRAGPGRPRSTGRPLQALRTPATALSRVNGSLAPLRLTTVGVVIIRKDLSIAAATKSPRFCSTARTPRKNRCITRRRRSPCMFWDLSWIGSELQGGAAGIEKSTARRPSFSTTCSTAASTTSARWKKTRVRK